MKTELKRYDIMQCALYKCRSKCRLEYLLGIQKYDARKIKNIISYYSFDRDKKCANEKRKITAPEGDLKQVQSRVLKLLEKVNRPEWLISGEKGKCYIDNGKAHLLANYVLTIDIKKFYDNCKREYVFRFFKDCMKTSGDVAGVLTDIVTYNQGIPTGCPTSQLIAYYAYRDMFEEVYSIAQSYGCKFTLYVDDMTFSSTLLFNHLQLANKVDRILRKYGHKPKYRKVKFYSKNSPKPVTGTIITPDHKLDVPNNLQKKVYCNFQRIKKLDNTIVRSAEQEKTLLSLKGQLQAIKNINSNKFPEISRLVKKIKITTAAQQMPKKGFHYRRRKIRISKKVV